MFELRDKRTIKVQKIEALTGLLNFLNRAVVPDRAFTRRLYSKFTGKTALGGKKLKQHHHITVDQEMRLDAQVWIQFLEHPAVTYRPIKDFRATPTNPLFFSDASKNSKLGFGCIMGNFWTFGQWNSNFIIDCDPSIEYLELFGLAAGILTWTDELQNDNYLVHCDNQAVVHMINNSTSSCKQCMVLIRILTLDNLIHNRSLTAVYVPTLKNILADSLSRLNFTKFFKHAPRNINTFPSRLPEKIWPMERLWI